jgi:hypothetical protein
MSNIREGSKVELLFPPYILLLKIGEMLLENSNEGKGDLSFTTSSEKFKEAIKKVAIEYCREAWKEGRMPLYTFKFQGESPDLERDLELLFNGDFILDDSNKITMNKRRKYYLGSYNDILHLVQYEEKIKRAIDNAIFNKQNR